MYIAKGDLKPHRESVALSPHGASAQGGLQWVLPVKPRTWTRGWLSLGKDAILALDHAKESFHAVHTTPRNVLAAETHRFNAI